MHEASLITLRQINSVINNFYNLFSLLLSARARARFVQMFK